MRVLVTPRSLTAQRLDDLEALRALRERGCELVAGPAGVLPTEADLCALLPGIDAWLCGVETVSERALGAADRLRVIARNGAGSDAIDLAAAERRGIAVVTAPGTNANGVAELTIGHILSALRGLPEATASMAAGRWERTLGRELADRVVGVVGYGAIGRRVARMAAAFGCRVLVHDPFVTEVGEDVTLVDFEGLISQADVITLHLPVTTADALIGVDQIARMRRGTLLINTARDGLIDHDAVLSGLRSGALGAYVADAFASEPPERDDLLRHPRVALTPHIGGYTDASIERATAAAVRNILNALDESA